MAREARRRRAHLIWTWDSGKSMRRIEISINYGENSYSRICITFIVEVECGRRKRGSRSKYIHCIAVPINCGENSVSRLNNISNSRFLRGHFPATTEKVPPEPQTHPPATGPPPATDPPPKTSTPLIDLLISLEDVKTDVKMKRSSDGHWVHTWWMPNSFRRTIAASYYMFSIRMEVS